MNLFFELVVFAFALFFLINLVRVLPLLRDLYARGIKPLACNVCMAFWTVLALAVLSYFFAGFPGALREPWYAMPVAGGVLALLRAFPQRPPPLPSLKAE